MAAAVSGRSVVFSPAPTVRTAASRFDRYSPIRRAVISPSGVSAPSSAFRCLTIRVSFSSERFRDFAARFRSQA